MLNACIGDLGSGKTLFLTIIGYYYKGLIVSNYILDYKNLTLNVVEKLNLTKYISAEYENCIIFIDEAYAYFESRMSGSHQNMLGSYVLFQSRKKSIDLYLTLQDLSTIDVRYRKLIDRYIYCEKVEDRFIYRIYNKRFQLLSTKTILIEKAMLFRHFYNTNEVIQPKNRFSESLKESIMDGTNKMELVNMYCDELEEKYEGMNITKDMLIAFFEEHDYPQFLLRLAWVELKNRKKEGKTHNGKIRKNEKQNQSIEV